MPTEPSTRATSAKPLTSSMRSRRSAAQLPMAALHRLHAAERHVRIERRDRGSRAPWSARTDRRRREARRASRAARCRCPRETGRTGGTSRARGDAVSPRCRTSPTMPTTVRHTESASPPPSRTRRPSASPSGQTCRASVRFTMIAPGAPSRSLAAKSPALQHRNPHRLEVAGAHDLPIGRVPIGWAAAARPPCPSSDERPVADLEPSGHRQRAHRGRRAHARDGPQPLDQALVKPSLDVVGLIPNRRELHPRREQALGHESRVDLSEAKEALHQEARPGHEHERDGHLSRHKCLTDALAAPARGPGASPVGQCAREISAHRVQRGRQPEQDAGEQGDAERVAEHPQVDPDRIQPRHRGRRGEHQSLHPPDRQQQARPVRRPPRAAALSVSSWRTSRDRPGPERRPERDLPLPRLRPREQQARHVGARDQEQQRHGAKQHQQRGPHLAHDRLRAPRWRCRRTRACTPSDTTPACRA